MPIKRFFYFKKERGEKIGQIINHKHNTKKYGRENLCHLF